MASLLLAGSPLLTGMWKMVY